MKMSAQTLRLGIAALALSSSIMLEAGTPPDRTFNLDNPSNPYNLPNLDPWLESDAYKYMKWGVLMSTPTSLSGVNIYGVTSLTSDRTKPFFLNGLQGDTVQLESQFRPLVSWFPNGLGFSGNASELLSPNLHYSQRQKEG